MCLFSLPMLAQGQAEKPPQSSSRGTGPGTRSRVFPIAKTTVTVDSNHQLFATLCALQAAGFEKEISDAGFHPLRRALRSQLLRVQGPATDALREYVAEHRLADSSATLSRFVSFALVVGPPPKFAYLLRRDELPPDVPPLEGFGEVLANFYVEAKIDRLWAQVQSEYEKEMERLSPGVTQVVTTASGYLRELLDPTNPRRFTVVVEPLIGARTSFRSYGTDYYLVVSPRETPPVDEIRHAFLHFLLDPLPGRHPNTVEAKRPLLAIAARAPRLSDPYRTSLSALVTECLVRAAELKLKKLSPEQISSVIAEAEADGFVLVGPFFRQLGVFQQAEPAMNLYYPDLLRGIRTSEELKRLEGVQFAARAPAPVESSESIDAGAASRENQELDAWLAVGDRAIATRDVAGAIAAFDRVLEKYPGQPRAVYGRAVAAVLQGDAARARALFAGLVRAIPLSGSAAEKPDALILSWSHVHLGRIYDIEGDRELALSEYRAALAVEGAPESAKSAARRGLERGFQSSQQGGPQRP